MAKNFNSREYITEIAEDVVYNFARAARATTPGLKGAARESEVRQKLESILPTGVGVGTGCVIDFEGNASSQQDIIIYENNLCPVFSINNTPETTYYPCEGVIAVGEIKSTIGKTELIDSFNKIKSAKELQRQKILSRSTIFDYDYYSFRHYLSMQGFDCTKEEEFNQDGNSKDQIFGFILCNDFSVKENTLIEHVNNCSKAIDRKLLPNMVVSLQSGMFYPYDKNKPSLCDSVMDGTGYVYGTPECGNFQSLLTRLHQAIRRGRTVDIKAFERYLVSNSDAMTMNVTSEVCL
ncbi:DUF6602 domain-containing protein [Photobacterium alginatilyticum]|uniref:DUF6602 domain-containing protein n=1 Tax=Photobacterium alginatilyticum TaxID=1775171 RepID=A0ABW9YSS6_9GAMM|nr:DUF6602 domain-containing protein [Photobacterium alginatilyticum]NBI56335.1 hypothetical protein [Photobacterium alginatilyticum]